ncbi:MAG: hypothetical protein QME51_11165 [Planctomycetota bacterium]|nr:hypothetical protein [Planctomycetota bacterium]
MSKTENHTLSPDMTELKSCVICGNSMIPTSVEDGYQTWICSKCETKITEKIYSPEPERKE